MLVTDEHAKRLNQIRQVMQPLGGRGGRSSSRWYGMEGLMGQGMGSGVDGKLQYGMEGLMGWGIRSGVDGMGDTIRG